MNPLHLSPGTHLQNMQDMASKGRSAQHHGEKNGRHKLNELQIKEIRSLGDSMTRIELAQYYGVSIALIYKILSGEIWKHIK